MLKYGWIEADRHVDPWHKVSPPSLILEAWTLEQQMCQCAVESANQASLWWHYLPISNGSSSLNYSTTERILVFCNLKNTRLFRRERRWHLKHPANQRLNGGKGTLITLAQLLNCTWYLATTQCYREKGIWYDWFLQTHENTSAVMIFRALNSLSVCTQEYHHAWPSYSL
jgi:hypothetical protein